MPKQRPNLSGVPAEVGPGRLWPCDNPRVNRTISGLLISLFVWAGLAHAAPAETVVGGPYVVNVGPRSATLMWMVQTGETSVGTDPGKVEKSIPLLRPERVVLTGLKAGTTYELQTPVTLLGRGTDCDLRVVDGGVSRHHAELRVEENQVVLVDLGSTNGTFVNGQPVRRVALTDGTSVTLGRTTLVFHQDDRY